MLDIVSDEKAQEILSMKNYDNKKIQNEVTKNIPLIEVNELPSGFKGYPKGTKISYEPLTLGELEALNTGNPDVERGIAMLLNSIHCNTLESYDLYYWDVMYIGIKRKLLAFGDTRGTLYAYCPKCGNIVEKEFDYTELDFKELQAPDLPVVTTISDQELEFGLLTMKEFLEMESDEGELGVYARMIKNKPFEEAKDLLSNCYGKDIKKIRYIDKVLNYGLKSFKVTCDNEIDNSKYNPEEKPSEDNRKQIECGQEVIVEVRSPFEVVFPKDEHEEFTDDEIRFGKA